MGKTNKTVRLTEDELRALCEDAVDKGVAKYISGEEAGKRKRQSGLLHNTKVLLENYRKLKSYLEKAESRLEDVIEDNYPEYSIQMVEVFGLRVDDQRSYTIAKGMATMTIIMNHVDKMLEVYRIDCEGSASPTIQRRWQVLERLYLRDKKMSTKEIAEEFSLDTRVIQEDAKRAREDMKVLLFGIAALFSGFEG